MPQQSAIRDCLKLLELSQDFFATIKPVQNQLKTFSNDWFGKQPHQRFIDAQLPPLWLQQAEPLAEISGKLLSSIEKLFQQLLELSSEGKLKSRLLLPLQHELSQLEQRFSAQNQLWQLWSVPQQKHVNQARWVSQQEQQLRGHACPLSVSFQLDDLLF